MSILPEKNQSWAAVILAGGKGSRMKSQLPKVLHTVCGKPMLSHVIQAVTQAIHGQMAVVVPSNSENISGQIDASIACVEQHQANGTGHAVLQSEPTLGGRATHVLVAYGDTPLLLSATLSQMMRRHESSDAAITLLTAFLDSPQGLGRIIRNGEGTVVDLVEDVDADESQSSVHEINAGVYAFTSDWLWPALRKLAPSASGEYYLTGLVKLAASSGLLVDSLTSRDETEILGVNTRLDLAQAEQVMRRRLLDRWMLEGVTVVDPPTAYIDASVEIGSDTVIQPNTAIRGASRVGKRCELGPNSTVLDSVIGDNCRVIASVLEGAHLDSSVHVGPFSHLRPATFLERNVHIGNYAEVKNSRIGRDTTMGHFSYVGDADVGSNVNIGAGAVTCNFDGEKKHRTVIEDGAFIGSDTMLVAPLRVGTRASTAAGSVVTRDVPADSLAVGVPAKIRPATRSKFKRPPA